MSFTHSPTPEILQWLSGGQLSNRLARSLRVWVILHRLYGPENLAEELPQPFSYPEFSRLFFGPQHLQSERASSDEIQKHCHGSDCYCQSLAQDLLFSYTCVSRQAWINTLHSEYQLPQQDLEDTLTKPLFAIVHRALRDDLKYLTAQGWLRKGDPRGWHTLPAHRHPRPPQHLHQSPLISHWSVEQTWQFMGLIEQISFIQPNLDTIFEDFYQALIERQHPQSDNLEDRETISISNAKRVFLHFDYAIPEDVRDHTDTLQDAIMTHWQQGQEIVIQFDYLMADSGQRVNVIVHPVCFHYLKRAKYLSAYGLDPEQNLAWHNYRLDRITSSKLTLLDWDDPRVPRLLQVLYQNNTLKTPVDVSDELERAWGITFYQPRQLLIIRFPKTFARWYVTNTKRHDTFEPMPLEQIPGLVRSSSFSPSEQQTILALVQNARGQNPADFAYFRAYIRSNDINLIMRLREWRPNGEVIAPLSLRERMRAEAEQELQHYQAF